MIQESTEVNFWLLEYHPILMSIRERYYLPTDCRLGLQEIEDWEAKFSNHVMGVIGSADCDIKNKIYQPRHEDFVTVYNANNNRNPDKGFHEDYVGLLRFVRALVFDGADPGRDLPWEDVERELSNRFPQMLIQLFGFLFKTMSENDLSFLVDRRSSVSGDD
ncbi:hypothetical protein RchiOBHm_Chr1g0337081 [Rosa chinensis]|uniref:Uncharacterized protein n=1 Tax=Rosa chinensis TaxID=74649 RepID=A0A2P6SCU5_ROSCH|nr:uncharacterized protein LOC112174874 [Rosa chinensis]XP_024168482.1 uncharacterized protein LOC112174874 [Rosa chinensis]XP_024168489.1 uncharacterized protein LOC112174874 [Rosa chinensis]XP_024168490.1 uncharacterized protein LOC112174874 [Rosa chinensis]PRQ56500.1 hypothetical protein RchiOBHm_Chr1g0337081 [Rosa chinensis]